MADGISMEASELRSITADLTSSGALVERDVTAVISKGAVNIKNQMRTEMQQSRHFKGAASSISYDLHGGQVLGVGIVEAEIGPDKDRAGGALANIAYFGTSRGGGTVPDPLGALEAEAANVEKYLSDMATKALGA